ncbi:two-component response regulator ORR24 [Lolium perenne]|uniref:two-component response regulator ORR24 n=1 Tax=Lolium perenne TaxID=4522 RepID=UPI0021F65C0F|nr:two-component response regulator ORR24-like [Lolium perenne]
MASGERRHGKEPAVVAEDNFPDGLRVLAVDDDPVCLRVLEAVLRQCNYKPTIVTDGRTALKMLREEGEEQFDLVITDVHMPNMDGFQLLEIIGLEMDLPVIMLSVNGEKATVYKGIKHGACDYIVKPVNIKKIRNIWQHVVRKNHVADDVEQRVGQPVIVEGGAKSKKCSKKKMNDREGSDDNRESRSVRTTRNKPRVSWTGELHNRFLEVVNQLGIDRAVPKAILQMMNVRNLSRESVASHLQKYRLYLKRVIDDPTKPNPLGDLFERRNSYMAMGHQVPLPPSSALCSCGSQNLCVGPPSILGPQGLSVQTMNWATDTVGNSGLMPNTGSRHASGPPAGPLEKTSDHPMQDAFPRIQGPSRIRSRKAYESVLCGKLLEVNTSVVPSSHPGSSSFPAEMQNGGLLEPANQFPVQPPELIGQFSGPMGMAPSAHGDAQFQNHAGNCSNPWQNVAPSSFVGHMVGAPLLASSQVNVNLPQINQQLTIFAPSSGQMAMFQNEHQLNQMAGTNINTTTSVGVYSEQMTPLFNMASSTTPMEMTNGNISPMTQMMVNGGSTSSPSPNLQAGNPVAPPAQMVNGGGSSSFALPGHLDNSVAPLTQMVNGGGSSSSALPGHLDSPVAPQTQTLNGGESASGVLPMQDDPAEQEAPDDQPTYTTTNFLEDIFASMASQDFNPDATLFGEEY